MIIMNLKLDNVLAFSNFNINFSYPMKLRKSFFDDENINGISSFRYKKLNIFLGANASGKTSLMKCIWAILAFLKNKEAVVLNEIINKKYLKSSIEIDFVDTIDNQNYLKRIKILTDNSNNKRPLMSYNSLKISSGDSYESMVKDLDLKDDNYIDYLECLNNNPIGSGWHTILPATEQGFDFIRFTNVPNKEKQEEYTHILNQVLKTLDPSIINVSKSLDANNAYVIEHENEKIIIQEGNRISGIKLLSSGTKYGINIANIMFSIKNHLNGIYIIDEQFSYVNSDVEIAMITTMANMLGPNEQLFITTHNSNILDVKFPFHSFNFLRKEIMDERSVITSSCASLVENRNNVSPKTIVDNDMLSTAPNVNRIFELGE